MQIDGRIVCLNTEGLVWPSTGVGGLLRCVCVCVWMCTAVFLIYPTLAMIWSSSVPAFLPAFVCT